MKPSIQEIKDFLKSEEFVKLSDSKYQGEYYNEEDHNGWKKALVDDNRLEAMKKCDDISEKLTGDAALTWTSAENNAYDSATKNKHFEVESLNYFYCWLASYDELLGH
jgi:hypothetical protein